MEKVAAGATFKDWVEERQKSVRIVQSVADPALICCRPTCWASSRFCFGSL